MSKSLAVSLGWVAPSERLSKTVERAQHVAYGEGALETSTEHLFAAELEDLDAVYFLAKYGIPLASAAEGFSLRAEPPVNVPRIAPPPYIPTKVLQEPHKDIPASPALRRVMALASAIAERTGINEVDGGIVLEALLEDGRSRAAVHLKTLYSEMRRDRRVNGPMLPGTAHTGAVVAVVPPEAMRPRETPPPPRKVLEDPLAQVRWLQTEVARELSQDRTFKFIRELDAFADQARAYISSSAEDLRSQAYAELSSNPIYRAHQDLQAVEQAAEALNSRVRQVAVSVGEGQPSIFSRFLTTVSTEAAQAMQLTAAARAEEKASLAAMRAQAEAAAQSFHWGAAPAAWSSINGAAPQLGHPSTYAPEGVVGFLRPLPSSDNENAILAGEATLGADTNGVDHDGVLKHDGYGWAAGLREKAKSRVSKLWVVAAAAGAGMVSLSFLL